MTDQLKPLPVIDVDKIDVRHAAQVYNDMRGSDDYGDITIDGIRLEWWADRENVWFYNPGDDGENTIKRFNVDTSFSEVSHV